MAIHLDKHHLKKQLYKNNTTVCSNIRLLRVINHHTQEHMANLLGMSRSAYYTVENGKRIPDFDMLVLISDFFDVNIDYLVSFDIAEQMLNMIKADQVETQASRFLERYFTLSRKGKAQIREEVYKMKAFEDKFRRFPWKYDEVPEMYSPCTLIDKNTTPKGTNCNGN